MADLEIKPSRALLGRVTGVILCAAAITGVLVYLLTAGGGEILGPKATLITYIPDSEGLNVNSPVRLSGIKIGEVRKVDLSPYLDAQRAVRVEMRVRKNFLASIPSDSQTAISADTLIGDKVIVINEGKSPDAVREGGTLPSEPIKLGADQADLIRSISDDLRSVNQIMGDVSDPGTHIGHLIMGDAEYQSAMRQISGFSQTVHGFIGTESAAGQWIYSSDIYDRIHKPLVELDKQLNAIEANKLVASSQQYDDLVAKVKQLRSALTNTGLDKDLPQYSRFQELLKQADKTVSNIDLGRRETYEQLNGELHQLQTLIRDLRENPRKYLRVKVF
jgi:phospholipid/cholesterol/gamma-HCH transport system substrate-binding protein